MDIDAEIRKKLPIRFENAKDKDQFWLDLKPKVIYYNTG
jgi:hypothetical protein